MDELAHYRSVIAQLGRSTIAVDALVEAIVLAEDASVMPALLAQLTIEANRIDWWLDSDFAAVALQAALPRLASTSLRQPVLEFAIDRARWCARCATAGGEGLARSQHVRELESLRGQAG